MPKAVVNPPKTAPTLIPTAFSPVVKSTRQPSGQAALLAHDQKVHALLARMTLAEKIGQMIQPDQKFIKDPADVERFFLGSVLSGGESGPPVAADYNLAGWTDMVDAFQFHAWRTRLQIPLLYGIDAVHGHAKIPGATIFPHHIGLGCTRDPRLIEQIAVVTAREIRATGVNWNFAPCLATPQDAHWGRTYEGFSQDPAIVAQLGEAAVRGLQGRDLADPLSLAGCAKHFVADGGTAFGTGNRKEGHWLDQGDARIDEQTLREIHLPGYVAAIHAGVATVMVSYNSWNGEKCSASTRLLTDLLKNELGFHGLVVSDYNAIDQITPDYKLDIQIAVNAGMDMVMLTERYPQFFQFLMDLVNEGRVPLSRIDDAVTRILRVKFAMGLMDEDRPPMADRSLHTSFGSVEHRQVARQAVQKSLVLLKNGNKVLPLSKTARRIHVGGRGADDSAMQCGGWTLDWQGKLGRPVPGATTILRAIQQGVGPQTAVTFSIDGQDAEGADVGIVVIGEPPYAEFKGDSSDLTLSAQDMQTVAVMKKSKIPLVVVILSGRPLILGQVLEQADAIIAAWLPGSEGQGVADILFGDAVPSGKLSFAWPRDNLHSLFGLGYGLTYQV